MKTTMIKNPAAVSLGQLGGRARAASLTAERRSEIARKAVQARIKKLGQKAKKPNDASRIPHE